MPLLSFSYFRHKIELKMALDEISNGGRYINILERNFKVTVCDADPEFVGKVNQVQSENEVPRSSATAITNLEEDPTPVLNCVAPQEFVESDGSCLSLQKVAKKNSNTMPQIALSLDTVGQCQIENTDMSDCNQEDISEDVLDEDVCVSAGEDSPCNALNNIEQTMPGAVPPSDQPPNVEESVPMDVDEDMESNISVDSDEVDSATSGNLGPVSISQKINLHEYSQSEWKGTTYAAEQIRLGYTQVTGSTGCRFMRKVRGDNYCGLRAVAFQILSQNLNVLTSTKTLENIVSYPLMLVKDLDCGWLTRWSFAGRLSVSPRKRIDILCQCLKTLSEQIKVSRSYTDASSRVKYFLNFFNSGNEDEIMIFEAFKLLMLHAAVMLHRGDQSQGPEFSWLLFARDSSETPEQLMQNHLNTAGDTGGLEQVRLLLNISSRHTFAFHAVRYNCEFSNKIDF